jgi:3-oxoadipate CoA-transferase beta subunit
MARADIARRAARDIPDGSTVNLGIGIPTLVPAMVPVGREVIYQSENGLLGVGPAPASGQEDLELINASKDPVTLLAGAAIGDSVLAFGMMRGGHLDLALLGAYQVAADGTLANWTLDRPGVPPGVGGAMDLAAGARAVWVLMEHVDRDGAPRIVAACSLPVTARQVVQRIYTDLTELAPGCTAEQVQAQTGAPLAFADGLVAR